MLQCFRWQEYSMLANGGLIVKAVTIMTEVAQLVVNVLRSGTRAKRALEAFMVVGEPVDPQR